MAAGPFGKPWELARTAAGPVAAPAGGKLGLARATAAAAAAGRDLDGELRDVADPLVGRKLVAAAAALAVWRKLSDVPDSKRRTTWLVYARGPARAAARAAADDDEAWACTGCEELPR